jgi:hypothetical protein
MLYLYRHYAEVDDMRCSKAAVCLQFLTTSTATS